MLKDNNYWISEDIKGGLYIGCYDDMLTIKVGQTLGSIRHRALQIDQNADGHFIVQFYYPFEKKFAEPSLNKIYALAMEDLLHNYMTQYCSIWEDDKLHKYRGEDHYECSPSGCKSFFHKLDEYKDNFVRRFKSYDERLYNIILHYSSIILQLPQNKALIFLLRSFNNVRTDERIKYKSGEDIQNERLAKIGLTRADIMKMTWEDIEKLFNETEGLLKLKIASAIVDTKGERGRFLKMKKRIIDALLEEDE